MDHPKVKIAIMQVYFEKSKSSIGEANKFLDGMTLSLKDLNDEHCQKLWSEATKTGHPDVIIKLADLGLSLPHDLESLFAAAIRRDAGNALPFVQYFVNVAKPSAIQLAFKLACRRGRLSIATCLLDQGIDINAVDHDRWTALHHAVDCQEPEIVQLLLDRGIDWRAKTKMDNSVAEFYTSDACRIILDKFIASAESTRSTEATEPAVLQNKILYNDVDSTAIVVSFVGNKVRAFLSTPGGLGQEYHE